MRLRRPISTRWSIGLGIASVLVIVAAYTMLSSAQHARNPDDRTIPTWPQLWQGVVRATMPDESVRSGWLGDGEPPVRIWIVEDGLATFGRLFGGLGLGVVISLILGMAMGSFTRIEAFFGPPLRFIAHIPPPAIMPLFFVLVGVEYKMFIAMIAFGVMPTLTQAVYLAARRGVPDELINKSYTLGASSPEVIWNVIFRHVLPEIIESVRQQIGPAMVYLIAAELMVGEPGIGYRIRLLYKQTDFRVIYYYVIILGAAGLLFDAALRVLLRKTCPWHARSH